MDETLVMLTIGIRIISLLFHFLFIINYDTKSELIWLNKEIMFKNIKDILKNIYLNIKKGI